MKFQISDGVLTYDWEGDDVIGAVRDFLDGYDTSGSLEPFVIRVSGENSLHYFKCNPTKDGHISTGFCAGGEYRSY